MKTIFKTVLFSAFTVILLNSCTKDNDYDVQSFQSMLFADNFSVIPDTIVPAPDPGTSLIKKGYTLFNEAGIVSWYEEEHSHDAYAKFTGYGGQASNIGWMITPSINMDQHDGEKLLFQVAQAYIYTTSAAATNTLDVMISSDFDGDPTHVLNATWKPLNYNKPIYDYDHRFVYVNSNIDLSSYTGNIHIAFKVIGGSGAGLSGTYQIDNIRVIY